MQILIFYYHVYGIKTVILLILSITYFNLFIFSNINIINNTKMEIIIEYLDLI
jgi:hypothetical protein